ncbi:MAG TPA: YIP1 family protein [Longimicrobiales bacterium]|nr:YIP1 family protein [Longimicrobiales bacterium]
MNEFDPLDPGSAAAAVPGSSRDDDPARPFPWPPAEDESVISAFGRTWQGASLRPRAFFASMPERASLGAAVMYYLSIGIAAAGAMLFFEMVREPPATDPDSMLGQLFMRSTMPLVDFLLSPLFLLLSLFVSAGVTHVMLKMLGAASRPYGFTVRTFAFAYSPQILGIIPYAGTVAGFSWMVYVAIAGLSAGQRTTTARAAVAVLVPLALAVAFVAVAMLMATTIMTVS